MFQNFRQQLPSLDDQHTRRAVMSGIASSTLGVSLLSPWTRVLEAAPAAGTKTAKNVIYFYMGGAMSHIDTFDPKPDNADVQGEVGTIATKTPGVTITELNRLMDAGRRA